MRKPRSRPRTRHVTPFDAERQTKCRDVIERPYASVLQANPELGRHVGPTSPRQLPTVMRPLAASASATERAALRTATVLVTPACGGRPARARRGAAARRPAAADRARRG